MLETAIKDILKAVPELRAVMARQSGRCIEVEITPLARLRIKLGEAPVIWRLRPDQEPVVIVGTTESADLPSAELTIAGSPGAFLGFLRSGRAQGIRFDGDSTLAMALVREFRQLDINWMQRLSPYLGEDLLKQGVALGGAAWAWLQTTRKSFYADLQEYLLHEARVIPDAGNAREWLQEAERLRQDSDRLEARLSALEDRQEKPD